jgi:hypothetical protein
MARFQVPRNLKLRDLRAELDEGHPYEVNDFHAPPWKDPLPCSKCGKPIADDDPVCATERNDPIEQGGFPFKRYVPEPVTHVTVWHFTCEPEPGDARP